MEDAINQNMNWEVDFNAKTLSINYKDSISKKDIELIINDVVQEHNVSPLKVVDLKFNLIKTKLT